MTAFQEEENWYSQNSQEFRIFKLNSFISSDHALYYFFNFAPILWLDSYTRFATPHSLFIYTLPSFDSVDSMNSHQNSSGSSTGANGNNTLAALYAQWLSPADRVRLVDEVLRTAIDINPLMIFNSRPAPLGARVDLSSLEYVEEYSHNLMCAICRSPYVKPLRLACQHVFCSSCFLDARNTGGQRESCPTCRERVFPGELYTLPKVFHLMLDDLIVKCPFNDSGCTTEVSRCMVQDHVDKYCEFVQVSCPYDNCGEEIHRRHLKQQRCLHKLIHCVECDQSCKEIDLTSHCATHDDERIVSCSGCATTILGSDLQSHENACPKVAVPCIAATYGCDFVDKRASIDQHNATCALAKLVPFLAQQNSRLDQQEIALQNLRRKNTLLEITCDKAESFFTSLSLATQVAPNDQVLGIDVISTRIASVIVNICERWYANSDLAKNVRYLDGRIETLGHAQLADQEDLQSELLQINSHVTTCRHEIARFRRELTIYRQQRQVPENVGVETLRVSELRSSEPRSPEDIRMVSRLVSNLGMSKPERVPTGAPVLPAYAFQSSWYFLFNICTFLRPSVALTPSQTGI